MHRYHRNGANPLPGFSGHSKGLPYVLAPMIVIHRLYRTAGPTGPVPAVRRLGLDPAGRLAPRNTAGSRPILRDYGFGLSFAAPGPRPSSARASASSSARASASSSAGAG